MCWLMSTALFIFLMNLFVLKSSDQHIDGACFDNLDENDIISSGWLDQSVNSGKGGGGWRDDDQIHSQDIDIQEELNELC